MKPIAVAVIPMTLLVSACGSARDLVSNGDSNETADASSVELATQAPGPDYEELQKVRGYSESECSGVRLEEVRAAARSDLQRRAAGEGADYVRVIGNGPLAERGQCTNDFYRVSGMAYARQDAGGQAETEASRDDGSDTASERGDADDGSSQADRRVSDASSDKSAADKLAELEEMRERGLISEAEYERLRQRILDDAF